MNDWTNAGTVSDVTFTVSGGGYATGNTIWINPSDSGSFYWRAEPEPQQEPKRMKKSEKWVVISRATGQVVERCESEDDALDTAAHRANKDDEEYIVFKAVKRLRPKPDVETVEA